MDHSRKRNLLLKEKARGLTIGITVLARFFLGLLVGGVRCLDAPGFNVHGQKTYFYFLRVRRDGDDKLEAKLLRGKLLSRL